MTTLQNLDSVYQSLLGKHVFIFGLRDICLQAIHLCKEGGVQKEGYSITHASFFMKGLFSYGAHLKASRHISIFLQKTV